MYRRVKLSIFLCIREMEFSRALVLLIMVVCAIAASCIYSRMVFRCLLVLALEEEVEDVRAEVKFAIDVSMFCIAFKRET